MVQRLFIAEKPSLARAIAEGLGGGSKQNGCIVCKSDIVTWCFGHLLEQCDPDDYDPAYKHWKRETLPIVPKVWRLKPRADAAAQLGVIRNLLKDATCVVNAGDPDREGQLLVDEVLEHFRYRGPVKRIWLNALDGGSVAAALASLRDNAQLAPLRDAALARSRADWLVGLNATRAMSILARECGWSGVLSQGRVQTPTLNLVVARDLDIESFRPVDYFVLQAAVSHPVGSFTAVFRPAPDQAGLDTENRLTDSAAAAAIAAAVRGSDGCVKEVSRETKKKAVPLPHCLSSLQKAASARHGFGAQQVLDIAQSLYEKKLTTYPRTDCRYLPESQFAEVPAILGMLKTRPDIKEAASGADPALRGPVWNTARTTAHHAIIPTGESPGSLTDEERAIYRMVAEAYCLQFYTPMIYEAQKIVVSFNNTLWEAHGRVVKAAGWTRLGTDKGDDGDSGANQALPPVCDSDVVHCDNVETLSKKTSPPPRFTEGTLIEAMANVHRFVANTSAKAALREAEGIGTEATRAGIIETLKKRNFIKVEGKNLVSTQMGRSLIELTPPALKDPVTTAEWESRLSGIAQGVLSLEAFMDAQERNLSALLAPILKATPKLIPGAHPCPVCGLALVRRKNREGRFFWSCSRYPDCTQPILPDEGGKPGQRTDVSTSDFACSECGTALRHLVKAGSGSTRGYDFFACPQCQATFPNANGAPGPKQEKREKPVLSEFKCPVCGKPLIRKQGQRKDGSGDYDFYSCSGYPKCSAACRVLDDGSPDYESNNTRHKSSRSSAKTKGGKK